MNPGQPSSALDALLADEAWARCLARALVGEHDGEEITQGVIAKALRWPRAKQREAAGSMRGYWARALRNEAANLRRGRFRRGKREQEVARLEGSVPDPREVLERIEQRRRLAEHLLALPDDLRYVLILRYEEGREASEIARDLGLPASTVRGRLARGLELLREQLRAADPHWQRGLGLLSGLRISAPALGPCPLWIALLMKTQTLVVVGALVLSSVLGSVWLLGPPDRAADQNLLQKIVLSSEVALEADGLAADSPSAASRQSVEGSTPRGVGGREAAAAPAVQAPEGDFQLVARLVDENGDALPLARLRFGSEGGLELEPDQEGRIDARVTRSVLDQKGSFQWDADEPQGRFVRGTGSVGSEGLVFLGDLRLVPVARYSGRVVDQEGHPLDSVTISKWIAEPNNPFRREALEWLAGYSDVDGRFASYQLEAGKVRFQATGGKGYPTDTGWMSEPVTASLEYGKTVDLGEFVCVHKTKPTAPRISFTDDAGQPVAPEHVLVIRRGEVSELEFEAGATSVELEAFLGADENVEVQALAPKRGLGATWLGRAGELRPELKLQMRALETIQLRASDGHSNSISIESVVVLDALWRLPLVEASASAAEQDSEQLFEIRVPDRPLEIQVNVGRTPEPAPLHFDRPPSGVIEIHIPDAFEEFEGRVQFETLPIAGARVSLHPGARAGQRFMIDDLPGRFDGTAAGVTNTSLDGKFSLPWSIELPAVLVVRAEGYPDRVIDLEQDPTPEPLVVELQRAGRVLGHARYTGGEDSAGLRIVITRGALDGRTTVVDTQGNFVFEGVAPGAWYLTSSRFIVEIAPGLQHYAMEGEAWPGNLLPDVVVSAGESSPVSLRLDSPGLHRIRGSIRVDGRAMNGWSVRAFPSWQNSFGRGATGARTKTDEQGHFVLELKGEGPLHWSTGSPGGGISISRDVILRAGEPDLQWDLDLHTATLGIQAGPHLSRVGFGIELAGGFWASGITRGDQNQHLFQATVLAGQVQLNAANGLYPMAERGPFDLRAGETLEIVLP